MKLITKEYVISEVSRRDYNDNMEIIKILEYLKKYCPTLTICVSKGNDSLVDCPITYKNSKITKVDSLKNVIDFTIRSQKADFKIKEFNIDDIIFIEYLKNDSKSNLIEDDKKKIRKIEL